MLPLGNATARRRLVAPCIAEAAASFKGAAAEIPDSKRGDTININASGQSLLSAAEFGTGHPRNRHDQARGKFGQEAPPTPQRNRIARVAFACWLWNFSRNSNRGAGYREI
jgi:hypothetical protein